VDHDEQIAWEARAGKPAAAAAFAAALLSIAAGVYLPAAIGSPDTDRELLVAADRDSGHFVVAGALLALSLLLVIPPLLYLFRAARHRESRLTAPAAVLAVLAAATLAVATMLRQLELIDIARDFTPRIGAGEEAVEEAAEDAIRDGRSAAREGILFGASIALAFAFVMISLNAMRAGLLSRFMAILGIFVGVLLVIPLGVQILQLYWFAALGLLFLDRWPGGRGPAWQTGEATPWPGAAQQREEIDRRRAERELSEAPEPEPDAETPRRTSRKRKKKRR
jgi:hypothetical protein